MQNQSDYNLKKLLINKTPNTEGNTLKRPQSDFMLSLDLKYSKNLALQKIREGRRQILSSVGRSQNYFQGSNSKTQIQNLKIIDTYTKRA